MTRRAFLFASLFGWLPFWRRRNIRMGGTPFRIVRNGEDRRHYFWVHGNERTAHDVLLAHMKTYQGRAFLVENTVRNIPVGGGLLDPNRMFSRVGAETNLRSQNPNWTPGQFTAALDSLDRDRPRFIAAVLPNDGKLLVAMHNYGPGYSVNDEVPISASDRMATVVTVEGEWSFRYTKLAGEWMRDTLETNQGDAIESGWYIQGQQTLTPRWFVAGRVERLEGPPLLSQPLGPRQTFAGTEETVGFRITPEITLRASYRARRLFSQPDYLHQAMASVVWARRWF